MASRDSNGSWVGRLATMRRMSSGGIELASAGQFLSVRQCVQYSKRHRGATDIARANEEDPMHQRSICYLACLRAPQMQSGPDQKKNGAMHLHHPALVRINRFGNSSCPDSGRLSGLLATTRERAQACKAEPEEGERTRFWNRDRLNINDHVLIVLVGVGKRQVLPSHDEA